MLMSFMKFSAMAFAVVASICPPTLNPSRHARRRWPRRSRGRADIAAKERINAWTVGLAGGFIEGAPLRLAAEIARVVNEKDKLRVIPIVTRGATENVNSLLYLGGVDTAIINTDALDDYKAQVPLISALSTF